MGSGWVGAVRQRCAWGDRRRRFGGPFTNPDSRGVSSVWRAAIDAGPASVTYPVTYPVAAAITGGHPQNWLG
ncbi:MAG: hypothetical protein Fur0042_23730 [Cyanophyceae cyanobacterium]